MLGAIIGDIVGSPYKYDNVETTHFELFSERSRFTDGTVMTAAVAEALMEGRRPAHYIRAMKQYGALYPDADYGMEFRNWLAAQKAKPYGSFDNGSALRVSPVGWWFNTLEKVEKGAKVSAAATHNHPEGIKGAQAVAGAIFLARTGKSKAEIREYIESRCGYDLSPTLDEIRSTYIFDGTCQKTVPEAITAFLESDGFEDAIRKAVSLGGDSSALAAITGSIAEAAYGAPEDAAIQALSKLDRKLLSVHARWLIDRHGSWAYFSRPAYELLFPYIDFFDKCPGDNCLTDRFARCSHCGEADNFETAFYAYGRGVYCRGIIEKYDGFSRDYRELLPSAPNLELLWAILTIHLKGQWISYDDDEEDEFGLQWLAKKGHMASLLRRMRELHEGGERWHEAVYPVSTKIRRISR